MTAMKATGSLTVLEAAFKIIPGKEPAFLAYQATVVPLAAAQPGFRAAYSGPVRDTTWVYFGARFDSEEQMNAWHGEPQHRVIQKSAPNWWTSLYRRKWRPPDAGRSPRRSPDVGNQHPRRYRSRRHTNTIGAAGAGRAGRRRCATV
jgi:heme-degrading monooxygenase HmoA